MICARKLVDQPLEKQLHQLRAAALSGQYNVDQNERAITQKLSSKQASKVSLKGIKIFEIFWTQLPSLAMHDRGTRQSSR